MSNRITQGGLIPYIGTLGYLQPFGDYNVIYSGVFVDLDAEKVICLKVSNRTLDGKTKPVSSLIFPLENDTLTVGGWPYLFKDEYSRYSPIHITNNVLEHHVGREGIRAWVHSGGAIPRTRSVVGKLVQNREKTYPSQQKFAIKEREHPVLTNLYPGRTEIEIPSRFTGIRHRFNYVESSE